MSSLDELMHVANVVINPYDELNVNEDDSIDTVKASYQRLLLIYHPDKLQQSSDHHHHHDDCDNDNDKFRRIFNAWKILSDPIIANEYKQLMKYNDIQPAYERVSSSEFTCEEDYELEDGTITILYKKDCRCGDCYEITRYEIDNGYCITQCNGCSLHVMIEFI